MTNALVVVTTIIAAGLALLVLTVVLYLGVSATTPPLTDAAGRELPRSIASLERIELGELDQWILIRGADRSNPVLLWLHGGPGGAQMPFAHHVDGELEQHFVVVHWDQRGAGKSNHGGFELATMHMEQYLEDAQQLIEHLRRRLEADKIVLLGHSWGTHLGMQLVSRFPEYFHAYVGVSQVVHHERATEMAGDWLRDVIDPEAEPEHWRTLEQIEFPARRHSDYRKLNQLTTAYGGSLDLPMTELARIAVRAPEYHAIDYLRLLRGMNRGGGPLHEGGVMAGYDFIETVPAVQVPVYFFMGAKDYNTPLALAREYHAAIQAPVKELVVFEHSAHLPFLAENRKFAEQLIRVAKPDNLGAGGSLLAMEQQEWITSTTFFSR